MDVDKSGDINPFEETIYSIYQDLLGTSARNILNGTNDKIDGMLTTEEVADSDELIDNLIQDDPNMINSHLNFLSYALGQSLTQEINESNA